jgi:hypothetical protein
MDRFIADTHGANHVLRNRPLFDWFFLRNQNEEDANLIVAFEGQRLISLLGYIPTKFLWGEEVINGAWMAHWMTLEGYRSGIGALLMRKITEMFPIVAGQGASLMNQEIVTKMKFRFLEQIPKVVYVLNPGNVENYFNFRIPSGTARIDDQLLSLNEIHDITSDIYAPDWANYPSLRYGTLRDRDYLTQRYIKYPFFRYKIFIEGDSTSPVVCVARIIQTTAEIKVARILEFFFPENESGKANALSLIKRCLAYFNEAGCDYVDFYCTSETHNEVLLKAGFCYESEGALPSLLDPIDMSRKFQNMELYVSPQLKNKYPDSESKFIVTRADGDQDRPNESYQYFQNW